MPSQSRITKFFDVTKRSTNKYNDFVYDPSSHSAFFSPDESVGDKPGTQLVTSVGQLRLWYVAPPDGHDGDVDEQFEFATNITPLLKSHLQKSIRRQQLSAAVRTAYTMCLTSPSDILRRLPIIAIEDVELVHGTSVIVWLMMTISKRQLTALDIRLILGYVEQLVKTNTTFRHDRMAPENPEQITHQAIVSACSEFKHTCLLSELLSLYYRMTFGGMPGDVRMVRRALEIYIDDAKTSTKTSYTHIPTTLLSKSTRTALTPYGPSVFPELMIPSASDSEFVMASIDFHCYPWMLRKISEKIGLSQAQIKKLNWFCDSSVNERKEWTKKRAEQNVRTDDWKSIKPHLDRWRMFILSKIEEQIYE